MKKVKILLVLYGLVATAFAQKNGIQFRDFNNWQAALDAAKMENKPLFVDFFTTWCGPCKALEQDVYPQPQVGDYFNQNFISVKVQMDKTKMDSKKIQNWYPDIAYLEKKYKINAYPTLLFLSPVGEIKNVYAGYLVPEELIKLGMISMETGHKYVDPKQEYYDLISNWLNGADGMEMVKTLNDLVNGKVEYFTGKDEVIDSLTKVSMTYLRTLQIPSLYQKDALDLISRFGPKSSDSLFKLFYPNTAKADQILGRKGTARLVVDRAIFKEFYSTELIKLQKKEIKKLNLDSLYQEVKKKYNSDYAHRLMDFTQMYSYYLKKDKENMLKSMYSLLRNNGSSSMLIAGNSVISWGSPIAQANYNQMISYGMNMWCWQFFNLFPINSKELKGCILMMEKMLPMAENLVKNGYPIFLDTYANLLYKTGRKEEAITWQRKAVSLAKEVLLKDKISKEEVDAIEITLRKMKAGIPTWVVKKDN